MFFQNASNFQQAISAGAAQGHLRSKWSDVFSQSHASWLAEGYEITSPA
jgi:hypothetical protein